MSFIISSQKDLASKDLGEPMYEENELKVSSKTGGRSMRKIRYLKFIFNMVTIPPLTLYIALG